jgi:cyclin-dependent kinase 7
MDFMDTDLEVIIKDPSIILSPANIKSYILQTLQVEINLTSAIF